MGSVLRSSFWHMPLLAVFGRAAAVWVQRLCVPAGLPACAPASWVQMVDFLQAGSQAVLVSPIVLLRAEPQVLCVKHTIT